ncbi:hypothetical protein ES705_09984 [subsurface metagenome]
MYELEVVKEGYIYGFKDGIQKKPLVENNSGGWNIFDAEMFRKGYLTGYKDSKSGKDLLSCLQIRIGRGEML